MKRIGNKAFEGSLASDFSANAAYISFPEGVEEIGDSAFQNCYVDFSGKGTLYTVTLPKNLKKIGSYAFSGCAIKKVVFPNGLESIGKAAFQSALLESVSIPASVSKIDLLAFSGCKALKGVTIADGCKLETLPGMIFSGCDKLENVSLGNGIRVIDYGVFNGCEALSEVTIPESVEILDGGAFTDFVSSYKPTKDTTSFVVNSSAKWKTLNGGTTEIEVELPYYSKSNIYKVTGDLSPITEMSGKCGSDLTWELVADDLSGNYSLVITGTGDMYDYTLTGWSGAQTYYSTAPWFSGFGKDKLYANITTVSLPQGMSHIGDYAFYNMKLHEITIPDSVVSIGNSAFEYGLGNGGNYCCSIAIPDSVVLIGKKAFYYCSAESIKIGESVKEIGDFSFEGISNVDEIVIPGSVEIIGTGSFRSTGIKSIQIKSGALREINKSAFEGGMFESIDIPDTVEFIGAGAFGNCNNLRELEIPGNVITVNQIVSGTKLEAVRLNEGTRNIASHAFQNVNISNISIPDSVNYIGMYAFSSETAVSSSGNWHSANGTDVELKTKGSSYPSEAVYRDFEFVPETGELKEVVLSADNLALEPGTSQIITIKTPSKLTGMSVTWTSTNEDLVTVSADGSASAIVTAKSDACGYAKITAKVESGNIIKEASCTIKVAPKLTKLMTDESKSMRVGDKVNISIIVEPENCREMSDFEISVLDEDGTEPETNIVVVTNRILKSGCIEVTAIQPGTAIVEIKEKNSELTAHIALCVMNSKVKLSYILANGVEANKEFIVYPGETFSELSDPVFVAGKLFRGWNTKADGNGTWVDKYTVLNPELRNELGDDWELFAVYDMAPATGTFSVCTNGEYTYTGKAIKPEVAVYDGGKLLRAGKDYKVSYGKKITNAYILRQGDEGFDETEAPSITVTGIGNYSDKQTVYFVINPKSISDNDVILNTQNMMKKVSLKGSVVKEQKLDPIVKWGKIILSNKNGKDYVIKEGGEVIPSVVKKDVGKYPLIIEGRGNYTGTIEAQSEILAGSVVMVSGLSVTTKTKKEPYTGKPVKPEVIVKNNKMMLTENVDYKVSYSENVLPGTATVVITGIGDTYVGTKSTTFTIVGTPISKTTVEWGFNAKANDLTLMYTGESVTHVEQSKSEDNPDGMPLMVFIKATKTAPQKNLVLGRDYVLSYVNNVKTGKGTLKIIGKGEYSGTKSVSFKIAGQEVSTLKVAVNGKEYNKDDVAGSVAEVAHMQGNTIPAVTVSTSNGLVLREGIDYTLSYSNNKVVAAYDAVNEKTGKCIAPTVTIKGKGLYAGTFAVPFSIVKQDISKLTNVSVPNVVWANKSNNFISKVSVVDLNGKGLKEGKDFKVTYYEGDYMGESVDESKLLDTTSKPAPQVEAGTMITVKIDATEQGSYEGSIKLKYKVLADKTELMNISKAKIVVKPQIYTGSEIFITDSEQFDSATTYFMVDKYTKKELELGRDFEVVGYLKNVNTGTATVFLRGEGDYTGVKSVNFKITVKKISN